MTSKRKYRKMPIEEHNLERMMFIGQLIRQYRQEIMSRSEFAEYYNISRSVLDDIENGRNITLASLFRVCDALKISPNEILVAY